MKYIKIILCVLFMACQSYRKYGKVNMYIDSTNFGWYYFEVIEDSTKGINDGDIFFSDSIRFQKIVLNSVEKIYNVYDIRGKEISNRMKFFGHQDPENRKFFFIFYNPSDKELTEIKQWSPGDSQYEILSLESVEKLGSFARDHK